jgi:hypothetical protein
MRRPTLIPNCLLAEVKFALGLVETVMKLKTEKAEVSFGFFMVSLLN